MSAVDLSLLVSSILGRLLREGFGLELALVLLLGLLLLAALLLRLLLGALALLRQNADGLGTATGLLVLKGNQKRGMGRTRTMTRIRMRMMIEN